MRAKKAMYNTVTSLLYQLIAIICGLITPRLILQTFGSSYNGVISSATQFLSMINILNIGIAGATRVELYKSLAADDVLKTSRIIKATKQYMRKVAACVIVYATILMLLYPIISHSDLQRNETMALIAIVSIGTFAQYFFGITYQTLLKSDQREYINSVLQILATVLNTILAVLLINLGANIFVVKLVSSITFAMSPIILCIYVKHKYKLVNNCEPDKTALNKRSAAAYHSIANIIHNNTDLIILTVFTDAKIISVYTVYYLVIGKIKNLMQAFTNGLEAAFGNMWAKKEMDNIQKNFRLFEFFMFAFVAIIFSCVGVLIIPFVAEYTDGVTDVNYIRYSLAVLITVTEAMFCIRQPYLTLVQAAGFYQETKRGAMLEAVINLISSIVLVWVLGINGVVIGTLLANTFRTVQYVIFISRKVLNRSILQVVTRFIWMLFTSGIIVILSNFLNTLVLTTGWLGWIYQTFITFFIACFITVIMALLSYRSDFLNFMKKARSIFIK